MTSLDTWNRLEEIDKTLAYLQECVLRLERKYSDDKNGPIEPLYCGLTESQWQRVIELGTLCEFSDNGQGWVATQRLIGFEDDVVYGPAFESQDSCFRFCRISTTPNHVRPCFGERPDDLDDSDRIGYVRNGSDFIFSHDAGDIECWKDVESFIVWGKK